MACDEMAGLPPAGREELMTVVCKQYIPSEAEPYMNLRQVRYFRQQLLTRRAEIARESHLFLSRWQEVTVRQPDILDQCAAESNHHLALVSQARRYRLIEQINEALRRIEDGTYGYCEETGEEIGLRRLQACPMAHLSVEAQEQLEKRHRFYSREEETSVPA
jgi:DnaK suppressor protein